MQPLIPNERRTIERIKEFIISGRITGIEFFNEFEVKEEFNLLEDEHKDLWLKILSMVFEANEAIELERLAHSS